MAVFEKKLPSEYTEIAHIENAGAGFLFDLMVLLPGIALIAVGSVFVKMSFGQAAVSLLIFAAGIYPYFTFHEITHGLVYMAATKQSVKIGFTKYGAYCAMSDVYVYRKIAVACTAAPLVIFSVLFTSLSVLFILKEQWLFLPTSILFAFHLFGCRSDMLLLRQIHKVKDEKLLVRDNGTEQWLYLPKEQCADSQRLQSMDSPTG